MASAPAVPAPSTIGPEVTEVMPGALKARVTVVPEPLSVRPEKLAIPAELVVAEVPPLSVAVPDAMDAVTTTPAWATALPRTSTSCSPGCGESGTPLPAAPGGEVEKMSWLAAPAPTLNAELVAEERLPDVAVKVYPLPGRLIERFEKVAMPFTAATLRVPERVPPPGLAPRAMVT